MKYFNLQISKTNLETTHTVSIDFWEQYDPTEVGAKGFALIGSELFHVPAICFLCGSAGKEPVYIKNSSDVCYLMCNILQCFLCINFF